MSDIQLYLLEADKNKKEATAIAERTAKRMLKEYCESLHAYQIGTTGLESKELKLVELIESLGEYLNHDDSALRAKSEHHVQDINSRS